MIKSILVSLLLSLLLIQCKHSDKVVSGRSFQKRKYTAGWYHNRSSKKHEIKPIENTALRHSSPKELQSEDQGLTSSISSETIVFGPKTHSSSNSAPEKSIDKKEYSKKGFSQSEGQKKKKSKKKILRIARMAFNFSALSTWFWGWQALSFLNIPIVGVILGGVGVVLAIVGFFKISKKTKSKGYNILLFCAAILLGALSFIVCLPLL